MQNEMRLKFIDALKSDKYKFTQYSLRSLDDCFCGLGVLCDVMDPNAWTDKVVYKDKEHKLDYYLWNGSSAHCWVLANKGLLSEKEMFRISKINDAHTTSSYEPVIEYLESLAPVA